MTPTDKPSIAELQRMHAIVMACEPPQYVQAAISALVVTTPVLLEIVAAALAMQKARREYLTDSTVSCLRIGEAHAALDAALAKVRP